MSSIDVEKICRVCLKDDQEMFLIFDEEYTYANTNISIASMITECTIYKVERFDKLPHLICEPCKQKVINTFNFKREYEESIRKLLNVLGKGNESNIINKCLQNIGTQTETTCERCDDKLCYKYLKCQDSDFKGNAVVCRFCSKSFRRMGYLKKHIAIFHSENDYKSDKQCYLCKKQFARSEHMRRHLFEVHNIKEIDDDDDDMDIEDSIEEVRNAKYKEYLDEQDTKKFDECTKSAVTPGFIEILLKEPMIFSEENVKLNSESVDVLREDSSQTVTDEILINCEEDCNTFDINIEENEQAQHNQEENQSNTKNISSESVNKHTCRKRKKGMVYTKKQHKCDICLKLFTTKLYLQRHMRIHEQKRYLCRECSNGFITRDELNKHIKEEGHNKPLLCPECGLRCKTSNILMVHMRRHKGEKPFKCRFCSKGFPRMDDVKVHEKYHTNEKSHFCETCGKGFQRKYNLTIHLRVHTGEKPYKCSHCPQAFAQGNDLKAHIRRHTGERFRCEFCGAAFLQGYQIRQHKLAEHGVKEIPPTQRLAKFTSIEEQEQQIKENLQRELMEQNDSIGNSLIMNEELEIDSLVKDALLQPNIVLQPFCNM